MQSSKKLCKSTNWQITDLGIHEEYVYDIETENHMFFANNILVHNSVYFDVTPLVEKMKTKDEKVQFLDKLFVHIEKNVLPVRFKEISNNLNTYSEGSILHMDREVIAVNDPENNQEYAGFWTAKKKYGILVNNNEGVNYEKPYLKVMGLSLVQSSTPEYFRDKLSEFVKIFIKYGDKSRRFVKEVWEEFKTKSIDEIALPRGVSNVDSYIENGLPKKGTPIQSKASIYYNTLLKKYDLEKKYERIKDADKIKFVFLKENPTGYEVIAFKTKFPKEFNLNEYIDYDKHFYKAFQKPIEDMFISCGWELEERVNVDDLFG